MANAAQIVIRPLSPVGGAEIIGIDASQEQGSAVGAHLRAAWARYSVLLLRDQHLTIEQQLRFGRIFGEISAQGENAKKTGGFTYVSNAVPGGQNPVGELSFHIDHSFYPTPLHGIMLYGMQVPPEGGDSLFANAKLAYKMLPESLKARIEGLRAVHCYDYAYARGEKVGGRIREAEIPPDAPRATHPVVLTQPETGDKILYISRRHTDRILGLSPEESEALIDQLLPYLYDPKIVFRHKWKVNDLVIFDNLAVQHARTDFNPAHKRHMRRAQIA